MQTLRAIVVAAGLGAAGMAPPVAGAIPGYTPCPSPPGQQYEVIGGATCEDSWVAQSYDYESGPKYQEFANFTCYASTADQKPVLLTCVSDTGGELVVSAV
ncbi:hypothetical protein PDG61_06020 [Mycolicibacterium sp. BiH015]|uniref:hypothetical protein n=1 Tax=Mycolicibacterium sp. BiH015 TaxID=3018808 RepID=UPI0022E7F931|nr:hypothetical protein [Mycolicibacterium sp. BiH015]MDA2890458.1 hypothetical protein [Mycolicibacterium sp. BiH015]